MKRLNLLIGLCLLAAALGSPAQASPGYDVSIDARRYVEGDVVVITVHSYRGVFTQESIDIYSVDTGDLVAQYYLSEEERDDDSITWEWDQRHACYGACQNVWEGDPARPGVYEVRFAGTEYPGKKPDRFSIGAYFHLGFDSRPNADFVVYSNRAEIVEQMRAELERPQEERQIVAGIVRAWKTDYNPDWSYVMGPRSIFLGEVFIEVCDGSPYYVERHLKQWRGEQWCPWSSYVESEGL